MTTSVDFRRLGRSYDELMDDRRGIFSPDLYRADVLAIVDCITEALGAGKTLYWFGNGGSAAEAQHLAAEFSGRFLRERKGLASEALSVNTSTITAIGNDFGYDYIFSRQIEAFVVPGDVVVGLTTSGKSQNIIEAFKQTRTSGGAAILFSGNGGGPAAEFADLHLAGPYGYSAIVQEVHLVLGHVICDLVEQRLMSANGGAT